MSVQTCFTFNDAMVSCLHKLSLSVPIIVSSTRFITFMTVYYPVVDEDAEDGVVRLRTHRRPPCCATSHYIFWQGTQPGLSRTERGNNSPYHQGAFVYCRTSVLDTLKLANEIAIRQAGPKTSRSSSGQKTYTNESFLPLISLVQF